MSRHRSLVHSLEHMATTRRLKAVLAISTLLPGLMFLGFAVQEHQRAARHASELLDQTSMIVHEHAVKVLETNEMMLERFLELLRDRSTEEVRADERRIHAALVRMTGDFGQLRNVMLWDEAGRPTVSSRYYPVRRDVTVADRAFFARHKRDGVPFSINEPLDGRLGGERIFNISRLRQRADGAFGGVVSASLSPDYFREFYRRVVAHDHDLAIALVRRDGEVVARHPSRSRGESPSLGRALTDAMDQSSGHGLVTGISEVDGESRLVSFRTVGGYPLYVAVSRTTHAVYAEWRRDMWAVASFFLPGALIVTLAIWIALAKARSEHSAILHHHEEEAKRRAAEDQLRQLHKFQALGQLTGGLAHDFNHLLHIVSTHAYLLRRLPASADKSRHIAAIDRAVCNGEALVRRLLAFARSQPPDLEIVNPADVVPGMCDLARHALPKTVRLHCTVDAGVWDVKVDRPELELALMNMTVNSRDAMPDGGVVEVRVRNVAAESEERIAAQLPVRDFVAIAVSDDGTGIPPDVINRVFEPFFTTKPAAYGSGLGLSRIRDYAVRLGGTAVARNRSVRGAVVILYIPRVRLTASASVLQREPTAVRTETKSDRADRLERLVNTT